MTDEDVLNLLADSKVSENPNREKDKYTVGQRAADAIAKFAGSWAFIFFVCRPPHSVDACERAAACCESVRSPIRSFC